MLPQTFCRRGLNTGMVSVVFLCSLCVGLIPAGCGACSAVMYMDTLEVILGGSRPRVYTLEVSAPGGQPHRVECGSNIMPAPSMSEAYGICQDNGAVFYNFSPDEMTITLLWDNHRVSQTFKPSYETKWPDGPSCQSFRVGRVSLTIP
jgi:hypothetical protein